MLHNARFNIALHVVCTMIAVVFTCGPASGAEGRALSAAVIRGATSYSQLQLLAAYQPALGQPITQANAQSIITAIESLYLRDGYSQPELQLDASQAQFGILGIDVFEARISQVEFTGDAGGYRAQLDSLAGELRALQSLRPRSLQDVLRRMSALPGLKVGVKSRRDPAFRNAYVIAVDTHFSPLEGSLRQTNRGTRDVGPGFLIGQLTANGLGGIDLKSGLLLGIATDTQEFRGGGMFVDAPLGYRDTRLNVLGFRSASQPTEHPQDIGLYYLHDRATAGVTHRWRIRGSVDVTSTGTFEVDDLLISGGGAQLQEDRLRVLDLSTQLYWQGDNAVQYVSVLTLRQGFNALGAGLQTGGVDDPLRQGGFSSWRVQFVRVQRFMDAWQLRIDALGQFSDDVLADRERFKIGGDRLGRGFEVPALAGDRGIGAKLELKRKLPRLQSSFGDLSLYGSYDIGVTSANDAHSRQSGATAAIGAGLEGKRLGGYLELARPLTHPDVDGRRRTVVFFDLTATF
ncbi:MAG TPA: ShlB/FhaC/HecB family hemolysin secretion/activation protein [Steroidobacteraceae bacterium]|jgi:hemolysin activation/secretion protein|nr:ShlB/FhaC/HecB family hemolysin secretion/activation protein [Steroidobacteraceae bacterium]